MAIRLAIRQKIFLLIFSLLAVTIGSLALLSAYSIDRQNEAAAYTALDRDLLTWQRDLERSIVHLRGVALREITEPSGLELLSQLLTLRAKLDDPHQFATSDLRRTLGYDKSVALGRLLPVLRLGGFSDIAVYLGGRLSHVVSTSSAGMMVRKSEQPGEVWISTQIDGRGELPLQSWPDWPSSPPPSGLNTTLESATTPAVAFEFPSAQATAIDISIPVLGRTAVYLADRGESQDRIVTEWVLPDSSHDTSDVSAEPVPVLAVVLFRKLLDRSALDEVRQRTGYWAAIYSPDGTHDQQLAVRLPLARELLAQVSATPALTPGTRILHRTVQTAQGSYYQVVVPWIFANRPRLILSLASSREPTLNNIRQTLIAIALVAGCILALSVAVGTFWIKQLIDPIVALTNAVRTIGHNTYLESHSHARTTSPEQLQPVEIRTSDEVGELAAAFNAMIGELRRSIETLEERVQARTAEATRLARSRRDFLAQMSHELRTPLNAILGYAQLLRRNSHLSAAQTRGLAIIEDSGNHLLRLINDILDLARIEAGKADLALTDVALGPFLRGVIEIIHVKAAEKKLQVTLDAEPNLPAAVCVDEKRLRQILLNLLGNAVKYTDTGHVTLRIRAVPSTGAEAERLDPATQVQLRFEVEDSGIGLSQEQVARLFQPFEQLGELKRREGGAGLGLAISNALVGLMGGGTLHVSSEAGRGSCFWFELVLRVAQISTLPRSAAIVSSSSYRGTRKKILVVDDVPHSRSMLVDMLGGLGFTVFEAVDGRNALEQAQELMPDLILMDLMMPVMDGYEATQQIRTVSGLEAVPILMLSASLGPEERARSRAAGATGFLAKPIDHDALLRVLGEQLGLYWQKGAELSAPRPPLEIESAAWVLPPADELERLYDAALVGSMRDIQQIADRVRRLDERYAPFATRLSDLARSYQSKELVRLLEEIRRTGRVADTIEPGRV